MHWQSLTPQQKNLWLPVAVQKATALETDVPSRINPYAMFLEVNANILNTGGVLQTTPSVSYPKPQALPAFQLTAILGTQLSLHITCPAGYAGTVLFYGAKPVLAGQNFYRKQSFKMLGYLTSLTSDDDIASLYLTRFRVPSVDFKVAIKVVGVSPEGLRTTAQILTAVVNAPGDSAKLSLK